MTIKYEKLKRVLFIIAILLAGTSLRMIAASRGYNLDLQCWMVCADIMKHGGNVYSEAVRYTTGPIWFHILHVIEQITKPIFPPIIDAYYFSLSEEMKIFRYSITIFLTFVDMGLFYIILKMYGLRIASIFFLNPITIILTGYHCQHDNLGLFVGLASMIIFGNKNNGNLNYRNFFGLIMLGLSLIIKHIFIIFPFWLAAKQKGIRRKLVIILVPFIIFSGAFIPYWEDGKNNIINQIFFYNSWEHAPFWKLFFPYVLNYLVPAKYLFVFSMLCFGILFRRLNIWDSIIIYTACIVIFSSGVGNQYYSIIMPFVCINLNWAFILFIINATFHLLTSVDALHFQGLRNISPEFILQSYNYYYMTLFLVIGFLSYLFNGNLISKVKMIIKKTKYILM